MNEFLQPQKLATTTNRQNKLRALRLRCVERKENCIQKDYDKSKCHCHFTFVVAHHFSSVHSESINHKQFSSQDFHFLSLSLQIKNQKKFVKWWNLIFPSWFSTIFSSSLKRRLRNAALAMITIHERSKLNQFHKFLILQDEGKMQVNRKQNKEKTEIESRNYCSPETSYKINDNNPRKRKNSSITWDNWNMTKKPPEKNVRKLVELLLLLMLLLHRSLTLTLFHYSLLL